MSQATKHRRSWVVGVQSQFPDRVGDRALVTATLAVRRQTGQHVQPVTARQQVAGRC